MFLTVEPGDAADLRDLYVYYVESTSKLATRPRVESRPDLGPGAFTLTSPDAPVATAYFPVGKNGIATLSSISSTPAAGKRDEETVDKLFALVRSRLH